MEEVLDRVEGSPALNEQEVLLVSFFKHMAIKRINECEDVALVAVLLASDAGAGITGSMISIDGGTSPY